MIPNMRSKMTLTVDSKAKLAIQSLRCHLHTTRYQWAKEEKILIRLERGVCVISNVTDYKVSKGAKIRNRYNQVPHLTQDTNGKVTNSQQTPQTRAKRSALSQKVHFTLTFTIRSYLRSEKLRCHLQTIST